MRGLICFAETHPAKPMGAAALRMRPCKAHVWHDGSWGSYYIGSVCASRFMLCNMGEQRGCSWCESEEGWRAKRACFHSLVRQRVSCRYAKRDSCRIPKKTREAKRCGGEGEPFVCRQNARNSYSGRFSPNGSGDCRPADGRRCGACFARSQTQTTSIAAARLGRAMRMRVLHRIERSAAKKRAC